MSLETATPEVLVEAVETVERTFSSARCAALGCAAILCADCPLVRLQAIINEASLPDSSEPVDDSFALELELPILDIERPIGGADVDTGDIEKTTTPPPVAVKSTTSTYLERLMDDSIKSVVADSLIQPVSQIKSEMPESSSDNSERFIEPAAVVISPRERQPIVNVAKPAVIPDMMIVGDAEPDAVASTFDEVIFYDVTERPIASDDNGETLEVDIVTDEVDDIQVDSTTILDNSTTLSVRGFPEDAMQIHEVKAIMPLATTAESETPYSPTLLAIDEYIATVTHINEPTLDVVTEVVDDMTDDATVPEIAEIPQIYDLATSDEPDGGLEWLNDELPEVSIAIERRIGGIADGLTPNQIITVEATALLDGKDRLDWERGTGGMTRTTLLKATTELLRQLAIHALRAKIYLPLKV